MSTKAGPVNDSDYINRSFDRVRHRRPSLEGILDAYEKFSLKRAEIRSGLNGLADMPAVEVDPVRFGEGVPVMDDLPLDALAKEFPGVMKLLAPALAEVFPSLKLAIVKCSKALEKGDLEPADCVVSVFDADELEKMAKKIGVEPAEVGFVFGQGVKLLMEHYQKPMAEAVEDLRWTKGYCPVCGSFPEISMLRPKPAEQDISAYLKAHGGQCWLHCSLCGHEWRFKRSMCAFCDNEDKDTLGYFSADGDETERVYTCKKCKKYIVSVDEREFIEPYHPDAAPLELIVLDMVAQDKGFSPMVHTPWNSLG